MAYSATVIEVMIASPGDVIDERKHVRECLVRWNAINASAQSIVLLPVDWESQAAPDLGGRAQSLINDRLLYRCDLLIGVFWTRLGTPTGEHASGTVEEIKQHVEQGKTAMIYFSSQPVVPGSYDAEQYKTVLEFKEWCRERGLTIDYDNQETFRARLVDDIALILRDNPYIRSLADRSPIETIASDAYQEVALSELAGDILLAAAKSKSGDVMMLRHLNGTVFKAGDWNIENDGSRREEARIESAIEQLEEFGLIRDMGYKREIFEVTNEGYEALERSIEA